MSRLYKCDFCGKVCENTNEIYRLEGAPCDTAIFDVDRFFGKTCLHRLPQISTQQCDTSCPGKVVREKHNSVYGNQ